MFDAIPPSPILLHRLRTLPLRLFHRSLLEFEVMSSTPPHAGAIDFEFSADFGDFGADFGASFGFDVIGDAFGNFAFPDFFGDSVTSDFGDDSSALSFASDDTSGRRRRQRRRRCRPRRLNRLFRVESVKKSCWYKEFTAPGKTRDLTHLLSSSDRYGKFRHYFRMPLSKVEELTDKLIDNGYVNYPRTRTRSGRAIGNVLTFYIGDRCCVSLVPTFVLDLNV